MEYLVATRTEYINAESVVNKNARYPLPDGLYLILEYGDTEIPHFKITRTVIKSLESPEVQAVQTKAFLEQWIADHKGCY